MEHTRVEKILKTDIVNKNTMLKKIRKMSRKVSEWQLEAETVRNRRKQKKYRATVARFLEELSRLKPVAQKLVEDLDTRIHEEMDFSQEEVKTFKEQLGVEMKELDKITQELEESENG